ncbi:MAG: helix-turn-helix domain-containing protein [Tabrizicola sp.]|jgi:predicted DNA-binding transcriptional regulator AlpA|nr:helix-turn-helix domain-containing protein [Tabrizicola sp.]
MDLAEEVRSLRDTVGQMADQLTRIGVGPKLMKTPEAAEFLGVSPEVMFEWRQKGEGPPFLHITARTLRYDRDDLIEWARSHRVTK